MKKRIAFFLGLVMVLSLCACGKDASSKKDDSSGDDKVKAMLFTQVIMTEENYDGETSSMKGVVEYDADYNIIGTKTYLEDKLSYEVTYDKDMDKPLLSVSYDEDGKETDRTEYAYDEMGNCLERVGTYEYDGEKVVSKCVSTYDAAGNVLTEKFYENGELNYEYRYTYTASGKVSEEINVWDGEESWTRYTYDEQDNILTEKQGVGQEENTCKTYENTYEDGKLTEVKIYQDGELDERVRYDSDGNEIWSASYMDGDVFYHAETTYENGKIVKQQSYHEDELNYCQEYTYNAEGRLIERSMTDSDGETQRRVYTYGDNGKLTGVKDYDGDELISDYALTYETVTVSKEVAQKIKESNELLAAF